ncbi:hypothetical protein TNCV_4469481 [Trichonephila clavipes]|nr:hypothetical protein TNCV_4469481 [Trichonephila clavipes]
MLRRLVGTTAPGHIMIVQFRNEKVSNHGSIPITIDCNVVAFIVFEEGFHQPIKRTKQSVFLDREKRKRGRTRIRWMDKVEKWLQNLAVQRWKNIARYLQLGYYKGYWRRVS